MSDFGRQVQRWSQETERKLRDVLQKAALDAFSEVVLMSPVDTGRFRGNWMPSVGTALSGYGDAVDPSGNGVIASAAATVEGADLGDVIWMVNNLPYAKRLEDGWSGQAPGGMVHLTARKWQPIVDRVVAQVVAQG